MNQDEQEIQVSTAEQSSEYEAVPTGQDGKREKQKKSERSGGNYYYTKLSYLGSRYTGDVFSQYFSGKIDSYRASEMLHSKVDHLPKLESVYFRRQYEGCS